MRSAIRFNVERWMRAGLGGIVALGTNGESALLDDDESDRVLECRARRRCPRDRVVIAGTGRESTRATIAASKRAAALGADAVLVRTPSFFKSLCTPDAAHSALHAPLPTSRRFRSSSTTFPASTGVAFTPDTVAHARGAQEYRRHEGIGHRRRAFAALRATPHRSASRCSPAPARSSISDLCLGAVGGILAVAAVEPELCLRLLALTQEGTSRGGAPAAARSCRPWREW